MGLKRRQSEKVRGQVTRERRALMLIATEGNNKTETNYFSGFKQTQKKYAIHFVPGNDTDTENIATNVRNQIQKMDFDKETGDVAFCVVDLDANFKKTYRLQTILNMSQNDDFEYILSNPCFEVWYLCHFGYSTKYYADGYDVVKALKKKIPGYSKEKNIFRLL